MFMSTKCTWIWTAWVVLTDFDKLYNKAKFWWNEFHCFNRVNVIKIAYNFSNTDYPQYQMQISYLLQVPDLDHQEEETRCFDMVYRQKSFDTNPYKTTKYSSPWSQVHQQAEVCSHPRFTYSWPLHSRYLPFKRYCSCNNFSWRVDTWREESNCKESKDGYELQPAVRFVTCFLFTMTNFVRIGWVLCLVLYF